MSQKIINGILIGLCFIVPISVYVYCKKTARGLITHFIGLAGGVAGVTLLLSAYQIVQSNIELTLGLGAGIIFSTYGFLCYDSLNTLRKYIKKTQKIS